MNMGYYGYIGATVAYGFFSLLLVFSWRKSLPGKLLFISVLLSAIWSLLAIKISLHDESYLLSYQAFEIIRYIAWYVFLLKLFGARLPYDDKASKSYKHFLIVALPVCVGLAVIFLINELLARIFILPGQFVIGITGNILLSLVGIALIEQLFRNSSAHFRWASKYLFLGAGGIFAFDFYMYSDALLFRSIDQSLWDARGIVHIVAVPLLAISSARNKNWSLNVFVSREIVLNTTAIFAGGFYLLAMAGAGFYIREFGGSWGKFGQVLFISLAVVFLFVLISSTQLRAQIKVFLVKHFYKNKYDYRLEWLRLTAELSEGDRNKNHYQTAIEAMAHIVDARTGLLWHRDDKGSFCNICAWQTKPHEIVLQNDSSLIKYFSKKRFVVNLTEVETHQEEYEGLELPEWIEEIEQPWLIIPLYGADELMGFAVLSSPLVLRAINWEDRDLLKTAAKQIASYLTVLVTSEKLAESKQFEVFTRLSAYMVHDLKNIAAELDLVAINARKHIENPEFIKDAFATVENAAIDINRLLQQLRNKQAQNEKKVMIDLAELVQQVVLTKQHRLPSPNFQSGSSSAVVSVEKSRLANVLAHLIDNAQQACEEDGEITLILLKDNNMHVIEIRDSGHGMDKDFIRERLFKPFDTTKGNAGMGIGMYESREFIRQSGGDIIVQSKTGKGTIIKLLIPPTEP